MRVVRVGDRRRAALPRIRGDEDLAVLAVRAGQGDAQAEAAFVQRTIDDVRRYCAHLLDAGLADDATQATYLRALPALASFRGESSPRTWLIGVARNTCLDERRALVRRRRLVERIAVQPVDTIDRWERHGSTVELTDLIDELDPDRREAFVLTQVLGFAYDEAAQMVSCPIGTIRSRVARARADLLAMARADDGPSSASAVGSA
ncbi:sigma-70 family RNA polymerase sigma factor [Aquihabitans sp. McL0605]|uniref:sigma-70 family RNA polymerase sigma factor n=1 Tax=Aquihabitans sp. McL0605 TaxID=3415671 RepID=UPI003CF10A70